jgi:hypothetical protein
MRLSANTTTHTSGHPGVTWDTRHGKWMVQIRHGRHYLHVGYLDDFDDARRVYIGAKLLLHVFAPIPPAWVAAGQPRRRMMRPHD